MKSKMIIVAIIAVCVIAVIVFTIMGKQVEAIVSIALALIGVVGYYAKNKNADKDKGGINVKNTNTEAVTQNIVQGNQINHYNLTSEQIEAIVAKTIEKHNKEAENKDDLPDYKQIAYALRENKQLQEAINSIDTNVSDKESADRHIFKAELLIEALNFDEAEQHYIKAATIFPSYNTNLTVASFYYNLNMFHEAIEYYTLCLSFEISLEEKAAVFNNMGNAQQKNNDYLEAEKSYQEALEIRRQLAQENPKAYLPNIAIILNNLGALHWKTNDYLKAEKEYNEALEIRRQLAQENPKAYLPDVAMTLNNLAVLHVDINDYPEAEKEYNEALKIRKQLAEENPNVYLFDVAVTLNNLAILHRNINDYPKAEKEYNEALEIQKQLAEENPKAYLPDVARTLNNLANLHRNINDYPKAEKEYNEALKIRRELVEENPKAYLPDMAMTLNNLAVFYIYNIPDKKLSLKYANDAIEALGKCNDTPLVREEFERAEQIIQQWQQ